MPEGLVTDHGSAWQVCQSAVAPGTVRRRSAFLTVKMNWFKFHTPTCVDCIILCRSFNEAFYIPFQNF